tara:strand:+ start:621 stop:890 length:270 start_codon:yes stop_codon:yes gene_type:complete
MTYENKYSLRVVKGRKDIHGLTLYEAEKALAQATEEGRLLDATGIYRRQNGKMVFVAFFSEWRGCIYPAFGANDQERRCIMGDSFMVSR